MKEFRGEHLSFNNYSRLQSGLFSEYYQGQGVVCVCSLIGHWGYYGFNTVNKILNPGLYFGFPALCVVRLGWLQSWRQDMICNLV